MEDASRIFTPGEIIARTDHTILKPGAVWDEIRRACDDCARFHAAAVCLPPVFVRRAKDYIKSGVTVCTVVGFPNGYQTLQTKVFETQKAVSDGAGEIDMVINLSYLMERNMAAAVDEISAIKKACGGGILKVIVETCLLTREEKIFACDAVARSEADFIKTSTGFSSAGALTDDIILFKKHCAGKKIKAAGGVNTAEKAQSMLAAGADRLGSSCLVPILGENHGSNLR